MALHDNINLYYIFLFFTIPIDMQEEWRFFSGQMLQITTCEKTTLNI